MLLPRTTIRFSDQHQSLLKKYLVCAGLSMHNSHRLLLNSSAPAVMKLAMFRMWDYAIRQTTKFGTMPLAMAASLLQKMKTSPFVLVSQKSRLQLSGCESATPPAALFWIGFSPGSKP